MTALIHFATLNGSTISTLFSSQPDEWMGLAARALPTIAAHAVESNGSLSQ